MIRAAKRLAWLGLAVAWMVVGCSKPSADSPREPAPQNKEPGPVKVLHHLVERMERGGFVSTFESNDRISDGSRIHVDITREFEIETAKDGFHLKGFIRGNDQSFPVEMYTAGGVEYSRIGDQAWEKTVLSESQDSGPGGPKHVIEFVKDLEGDRLPEGITMTRQQDRYVFEFDHLKAWNSEQLRQYFIRFVTLHMPLGEFPEIGIHPEPRELMIVEFSETMEVDAETFRLLAGRSRVKAVIPADGGKRLEYTHEEEISVKGDFGDTIQVPEAVIQSAR
ncbi:hypothetical protein [Staphylospora marina]|uniref:hypothetical protein n=1 Tax=Staphylospora marina TaxID=2490858 RepID=UPI000F5BB827|nr:hypothetical protein [Staphylospora marina]